jgi:transcriptional regulator with XRE-family HTH domain
MPGLLPEKLREMRARAVLSQRELARLSGVGQVTIARIETGIQKPRPSTLRKLARALRVKPVDLLEED